jgi:hypothetical protein
MALSVHWHEGNGCWTCCIGYGWNKSGTRLRPKQFYFRVAGEAEALLLAAERQRSWAWIQDHWPAIWMALAARYPQSDGSRPFWVPLEEQAAPPPTPALAATVTLQEAAEQYTAELAGRRGLKGKRALKPLSVQTRGSYLKAALRFVPEPGRALATLDRQAIVDAANAIWSSALAERTMANYTCELRQFLAWLAEREELDWTWPKGARKLLSVRALAPAIRIPRAREIRRLVRKSRGPLRALILLALNTGMTNLDLANLRPGQLRQGGKYLKWQRQKTSHQNRFVSWHWLWPETRKAITRHRSGENPAGLLFARRNGAPWVKVREKSRTDRISIAFAALVQHCWPDPKRRPAGLSFKSLRKFSAQHIKRLAGPEAARLYLGHAIPGVFARYVRNDYRPLHRALRSYRAWLAGRGILGKRASAPGQPPPRASGAGSAGARRSPPGAARQ